LEDDENTNIAVNLLNNIKIRVEYTLGGDVFTVAHNMHNHSLYFYTNSNKPNNRPINQGKLCDWGPYIIYKVSYGKNYGVIIYIGENFIAKTVFSDDISSLNW
jgi:hypothetical protein